MKKLVTITGIILLICLMLNTFFVPVSSAKSVKTVQSEQNIAEEVYIIKAENNRIVVYKKGESTPCMQTDTRCDMLPKGDVVYLENGIEVEGRETLRKTLEDYCS